MLIQARLTQIPLATRSALRFGGISVRSRRRIARPLRRPDSATACSPASRSSWRWFRSPPPHVARACCATISRVRKPCCGPPAATRAIRFRSTSAPPTASTPGGGASNCESRATAAPRSTTVIRLPRRASSASGPPVSGCGPNGRDCRSWLASCCRVASQSNSTTRSRIISAIRPNRDVASACRSVEETAVSSVTVSI